MEKYILGLIAAVVAVILLVASVRVVDTSETCAIVVLGQVVGEARTGLQFVWPIVTSTDCYPSQGRLYMTSADAKGDGDWMDFPVEIKTKDGQTAFVEFNLRFSVPDGNAVMIRNSVASNEDDLVARVIANYARSIPRDLAPKYTADQLYGAGRSDYEQEIEDGLRQSFADDGVTLEEFSLRDVNFSPDYEATIESQQIAREKIETAQFEAQAAVYTAEQTAALAKGDADAEIERAKGHAESVRIQAQADAESIRVRGEALERYPQFLSLQFLETLAEGDVIYMPWDMVQPFMPLPVPGQ